MLRAFFLSVALTLALLQPAGAQMVKTVSLEQYEPDTIVISIKTRSLHYKAASGEVLTYRIGVPRVGLSNFYGEAYIASKADWPRWTPTEDMMQREPEYRQYAGGMEGGAKNPLGARALYLFRGGRDTMLRIHGTDKPWTIGQEVSSGCFRMTNKDVIELDEFVRVGTKVVVLK